MRVAETALIPATRETMRYLAMRWRAFADEAEAKLKSSVRHPNRCPPVMDRAFMKTTNELRAEAARLREFARRVTEREALEEIQAMIAKLDRRARALGMATPVNADREAPSDYASWMRSE